ncbi:hypothetical protein PCE1_002759 [Barthelona sp. PCE]
MPIPANRGNIKENIGFVRYNKTHTVITAATTDTDRNICAVLKNINVCSGFPTVIRNLSTMLGCIDQEQKIALRVLGYYQFVTFKDGRIENMNAPRLLTSLLFKVHSFFSETIFICLDGTIRNENDVIQQIEGEILSLNINSIAYFLILRNNEVHAIKYEEDMISFDRVFALAIKKIVFQCRIMNQRESDLICALNHEDELIVCILSRTEDGEFVIKYLDIGVFEETKEFDTCSCILLNNELYFTNGTLISRT